MAGFSFALRLSFDEEPVIFTGRQEKLLLAAIIRRTAFDIALYKDSRRLRERRIYLQAYQWMFRKSIPGDPCDRFTSFETICEVLGQDPEQIRSKTLRLEKSDVKKFDRVGL